MADATAEFFAELGQRGHEPLLASTSGTLRFDLADGRRLEHWYVTIEKGNVAVSHENSDADAVVRLDRSLFDSMATGKVNAMSAALRGVLAPEGNLGLIISFQRLFPGPPRSRARASTVKPQRSAK
jgi:putative sterol carrier protein